MDVDRIDWDEPTFLDGEKCNAIGCNRPATGFLVSPTEEVMPNGVCRKCGEATGGHRFEEGVLFKDWQSGNIIRGVPTRLKRNKMRHIEIGRVNRTHCGRDSTNVPTITAQEYLRAQNNPALASKLPIVCNRCAREVRKLVVTA